MTRASRLTGNQTMTPGIAQAHNGSPSEVGAEIARYLAVHPDASDNLIGVVRCWLNRDPSQTTLSIVEAALNEMVSRGEIERRALPDGGAVFRRASRG
jgi:hypothetical protein